MSEFLRDTFEALDTANVRYCRLRGGAPRDDFADYGDIDLVVEERHLSTLHNLLCRRGFARLPSWGRTPHHFYVTYDATAGCWIKLDFVTAVAYGRPTHALHTDLASNCIEHRRRCGAVYAPSPEDEVVALTLHCIIDKGAFSRRWRQRLTQLSHEVTDAEYASTLLADYWPPTMTWSNMSRLISEGQWDVLLAERPAITQRLVRRNGSLRVHGRRIRDRALRVLDRRTRSFRAPTPLVALLAPDGAGKSTLAAGLQDAFYVPVRIIYMGLYQNGTGDSAARRIPGLGLAGRLLTQWRRYLQARYEQAQGRLVVFDRYTYDALLSSARSLDPLRRLRRWLLAHACPQPDLVLLLDAPGEVLYARKGEHDVRMLEQQRRQYLAMQSEIDNVAVIDATDDTDHVQRTVLSHIWREYAQRLNGKEPR